MCAKRDMGDVAAASWHQGARGAGRWFPLCRRAAARVSPGGAVVAWGVALAILVCLPGAAAQPAAPARATAAKPSLAAVDHAGLMAAVARHKGKVVILDCWSTSCPPCVKEFPRLVALQDRYGDKVVCMSVSLDFEGLDPVDTLVTPVLRFLQDVQAGGVVNLIATEEADTMYKKLELDSVPAVYVWKADGTLARRFDEGDAKARLGRPFTYDDVEAEVKALLAK